MNNGIERDRDRLLRATSALDKASIPYAFIGGGNAVAGWVSRVDDSVVRNTRDVDLLVRCPDFKAEKTALEGSGFHYKAVGILGKAGKLEVFLDGPNAKVRDAVHIVFACEPVTAESLENATDVSQAEVTEDFRLLSLEALVTMNLTAFRDKDRVHLRDMMEIGMLDASCLERVPENLRRRLQDLIDDPHG